MYVCKRYFPIRRRPTSATSDLKFCVLVIYVSLQSMCATLRTKFHQNSITSFSLKQMIVTIFKMVGRPPFLNCRTLKFVAYYCQYSHILHHFTTLCENRTLRCLVIVKNDVFQYGVIGVHPLSCLQKLEFFVKMLWPLLCSYWIQLVY